MPCDCSHLKAKDYEVHRREAAKVYVWVKEKAGEVPEPWAVEASKNYYGESEKGKTITPEELCGYLRGLGEEKIWEIVNANKDAPLSGELLSWWNKHKEYDKEREITE